MRMREWGSLLAGLALACGAMAQTALRDGIDIKVEQAALDAVLVYIEHKDCAGAVRELNQGLAKGRKVLYLMAGAMYEEGLCLKPSRERATHMFQRAHESGQPSGLPRLVAALAAPGAEQDLAAALWWALSAKSRNLPATCEAARPLREDPDKFVAALKAWPAGQLQACAYVAAVHGAISGDAEFPGRAAGYGLTGRVRLDFTPAAGRIDVTTLESEAQQVGGVVSGDMLGEARSREGKRMLENYLRGVSDRALARFPRPEGIDPSWRTTSKFDFFFVP